MARLTKRQKEYREKLRDPRWQKLRLQVLDAADWRCTWCGRGEQDKTNLQIHHGYYTRDAEPWEYPPEALHVLCEHCHEQGESLKAQVLEEVGKVPPQYHQHIFYFAQELRELIAQGDELPALEPWKPKG